MKIRWSTIWGLTAVLLAAPPLSCQARPVGDRTLATTPAPALPAPAVSAALSRGSLVREVVDPATGNRWLLERDARYPGGPGRMVLAGSPAASENGKTAAGAQQPMAAFPVIRAGDLVMLVAHTAAMDAELEAVALAPAAAGDAFRARLKMGGAVVDAVAVARGRAQWLPNGGETR